jgi:hypothetical protein
LSVGPAGSLDAQANRRICRYTLGAPASAPGHPGPGRRRGLLGHTSAGGLQCASGDVQEQSSLSDDPATAADPGDDFDEFQRGSDLRRDPGVRGSTCGRWTSAGSSAWPAPPSGSPRPRRNSFGSPAPSTLQSLQMNRTPTSRSTRSPTPSPTSPTIPATRSQPKASGKRPKRGCRSPTGHANVGLGLHGLRFEARGRIRTDDLPITSRMLRIDLDGSRRI